MAGAPAVTELLAPAPAPAEVRAARLAAGLSQPQMAGVLGLHSHRTVQAWESGQNPVAPGLWALFLLATGQHPTHLLRSRSTRLNRTRK